MNRALLQNMALCETDVEGVLQRLSGNEDLFVSLLDTFLADPTMEQLENALEAQEWDAAFTAAHALKGLAGNMGFIPLFHATAELVILIRAGRIKELDASLKQVRKCHDAVTKAIRYGEEEGKFEEE